MDTIVIPNIDGTTAGTAPSTRCRSRPRGHHHDQLVAGQAVTVNIGGQRRFAVRMIDCVGYIVPSALGYVENDMPRMVMTPWYDEPIPFNMAAEIGTKKVITEHSTIGLVVTTDGSISDIPREEYEEAEERVISELKEINK
ncbi:MAG: stage IV sporulation protein A, partial [Anaeromassilibacillus sp.]